MPTIAEYKQKYPAYQNVPDRELADRLYDKFYSDKGIGKADFYQKVGIDAGMQKIDPLEGTGITADMSRSDASKKISEIEDDGMRDEVRRAYADQNVRLNRKDGGAVQRFLDGATRIATSVPIVGSSLDEAGAAIATGGGLWGDYELKRDAIRAMHRQVNDEDTAKTLTVVPNPFGERNLTIGDLEKGFGLVGGAIAAPMANFKKLSTAKNAMLTGLGYGAGEGFASAEGGGENRAAAALSGGLTGAAIGGVVGKGADYAGGKISDLFQNRGIKASVAAMKKDNVTIDDLVKTADRMKAQNVADAPTNLLDVAQQVRKGSGSNVAGIVKAAEARPGPAQAQIREMLVRRSDAQKGRISNFVGEKFGAHDFAKQADDLAQKISSEAKAAYRDIYNQPPIQVNDTLARLLKNEDMKRALAYAKRLADAKLDDATLAEIKGLQKGIRRASGEVEDGIELTADDIAKALTDKQISVHVADNIQRSLRLSAERLDKDPNVKKALLRLRKTFLDEIDPHVPGFDAVRKTYGSGKSQEEALAIGEQFVANVGGKQRDLLSQFKDMTPAQQDMARLGISRKIMDDMQNTGNVNKYMNYDTMSFLKDVYGAKNARELLKQFKIEQQMKVTNQGFQGSRTVPLGENIKEQAEIPRIAGSLMLGKIDRATSAISDRLARKYTDKTGEEIVNIWLSTNARQQAEVLRKLTATQKRRLENVLARNTAGMTAARSGIVAGSTSSGNFQGTQYKEQ